MTDDSGVIVALDAAAMQLLNLSSRAVGQFFPSFIGERRPEVMALARAVPSAGTTLPTIRLKPRERRAVAVAIELRPHPNGVEWLIARHDAYRADTRRADD